MEHISKNSKIFISGHTGMVGSVTLEEFKKQGYTNLIVASSKELDLRVQADVNKFFENEKPDYVIHVAAKVGGINANINNPAGFLYDNLMIQCNVIEAAFRNKAKKFIFLGSSCIYPKDSLQPMKEEYLLSGKPEPTNEGYALAKIAGIKLLESYHKQFGFNSISLIPSNLYGHNDCFDLHYAHVLSSLVKRFVDAQLENLPTVKLWGTGIAKREFLYVTDIAKAIIYFFENFENIELVNIGPGTDISIKDLAALVKDKVGYEGEIEWDNSKPDGMLTKCMDVTQMKDLGFKLEISLETGVENVVNSYKKIIIS
jgi:GDP-L-fucose synthase